ncbi:MAG: DMT family transporter [Synergistaceae bacterium]|nr:DMT family transporter [Synergistaceae bacterium]
MSKLEANISLLIITFLGSVQYVFLAGVPESVSHFAFLCITNLVGFVIAFAFFFGELFRLDTRQIFQSMILSSELVVFNLFMLLGASGLSSTITASVLSLYFIFVVIFSAIFMKIFPDKFTIAGVITVFAGLFLMIDADIKGLFDANVFYLVLADAALALYILTIGAYASTSNPSILAMGQMFFCFVFSLVLWAGESLFFGASFTLPSIRAFWGAVIYVSFFMRGLYGIVQIYAQRYVTPLNTSLIFSTEIIMTTFISPLMSRFFGTPPENITAFKIVGSVLIVGGLLLTEPGFTGLIKKFFVGGHDKKISVKNFLSIRLHKQIIIASAAAYFLIDFPVQLADIFPVHVGIKNFLPFTLGLFFGINGVIGCCLGCALSFSLIGLSASMMFHECVYISITGLGIWAGWHSLSRSHRILFQLPKHYMRYFSLVLMLSALCLDVRISGFYIASGLLIALPINIIFGSLLGIDPILPGNLTIKYDAEFVINSDPETLNEANETLETAGFKFRASMKQVLEIQSCIEELSIRILNVQPEAKINIQVRFGNAVSVKMNYMGAKYNPFIIRKDEDMLDIMSLKIIKHRALRASYSYGDNENFIHVVV